MHRQNNHSARKILLKLAWRHAKLILKTSREILPVLIAQFRRHFGHVPPFVGQQPTSMLHFDMTDKANESDNPGKFKDIIMRRLRRGECYHMPYFGCREFPAHFELYEKDTVDTAYAGERRELGYMLYDMDYTNLESITPMFFRAALDDGVLDVRKCEVVR